MGEFTQNLLKLTEFPFSYSLIGLLSLIFGQGTNLEELSFNQIGPLLILIGFVATTLSICDPIGAVQRLIIKGRELRMFKFKNADDLTWASIFGDSIIYHFPLPYLFAIAFSPEDIKKKYTMIDWDSIDQAVHSGEELFGKSYAKTKVVDELNKIHIDTLMGIGYLLEGLKQQTVKTKWITAEIDRVTALIYFMIIISLFIVATHLSPVFLQNFAQFFENIELAKLGILIFSILALIGVIIMFIYKIFGILQKASVVFEYLTSLEAIKKDKENFKTTLESIEHYLDDNNWTLAEYWVKRIQVEYTELFLIKVK
jgi:hypothetical protein